MLTMSLLHIAIFGLVVFWFFLPSGHRLEVPIGQLIGVGYVTLAVMSILVWHPLLAAVDITVAITFIVAPRGLASLRRDRE